jgi:hypothetical protein
MLEEKSTYTIFKNRKISFEKRENDYRYVKANEDINEHELLLVEHVITKDDLYKLGSHVKFDDDLLKNLYPRNETDILIDKNDNNITEIVFEKVQKNAFGKDNIYTLGKDISLFNHSINPNCIVSYNDILIPDLEYEIERINYVYSIKKIKKEEELFIYYGKNYFGDKEEIIINYIDSNYLVKNIIKKYTEKQIFKKIMLNHICAYYGIYFNNNRIVLTPRVKETIKENYVIWIFKKALSMGLN